MRRHSLFAGVALASLTTARRMAEAPEEGAPAAPVEGVTQDGGTTRFVPPVQEAGAEAPAATEAEAPVKPEGLSDEDWGLLQEAKATKAAPAEEPKIETKGTKDEAPKEGLDLLVAQQTEGMSEETAAVVGPLVRTFAENGDLSPEEVTAAAKATGLSETIVRQYVDNAKLAGAQAEAAATQPFFDAVGGQENYAGFQAWANEALGPDDLGKINEALGLSKDGTKPEGTPDVTKMQTFVDAWKSSGRGPAPTDLTDGATGETEGAGAGSDVFTSRAEQNKVINSHKYKNDPVYRKQMEAKIGRSNV